MKEKLSALMDGEWDDADLAVMARVAGDPELRRTWDAYHVIGDALRGHLAGDAAARVSRRLAEEPTVLAPRPRAARARLAWYAMSAAASVAAIVLVAWTALPLAPPRPQIVGGTASPIVPVAASTAPAAETQPRVATADLEEYLLAHQPYSDTSAMRGWAIRSAPPGFRIVGELTRTLGGKPGVGHIVLSDGLAAISVFIEPAKQPARAPGLVRQGAINIYMRPLGDYWVTVVGEAPAESVKYVADAVDFRK